jgi:hypothetical protein
VADAKLAVREQRDDPETSFIGERLQEAAHRAGVDGGSNVRSHREIRMYVFGLRDQGGKERRLDTSANMRISKYRDVST